MNEGLLVYLLSTIWSTYKEDVYFDGNYFSVGHFLFDEQDMESIYYTLREWSYNGCIDEMYGRFLSEKKLWQDTITA